MRTNQTELKSLFEGEGTIQSVSGNSPWIINDVRQAWEVLEGHVMIFLYDADAGYENSRRKFVMSVKEGDIIPGVLRMHVTKADQRAGLLAVPGPNTIVKSITYEKLEQLLEDSVNVNVHQAIDVWVQNFITALGLPDPPNVSTEIGNDKTMELAPGQCIHAHQKLLWVRVPKGKAKLSNTFNIPTGEFEKPYPLCSGAWIVAYEQSNVNIFTSTEIAQEKLFNEGMELFHSDAMTFLDYVLSMLSKRETEQIFNRSDLESTMNMAALTELASVLEVEFEHIAKATKEDPYLSACKEIGKHQGIHIVEPPEREKVKQGRAYVQAIAKTSNIRVRELTLFDGWSKHESGPMLGFLKDDHTPIALLPKVGGGFNMFNSKDGKMSSVTPAIAKTIDQNAYVFYRHFPFKAIKTKDIIIFALRDLKSDLKRVAICATSVGLLGLLTPLITGKLFNKALPEGELGMLAQFTAFLAGSAFASMTINICQNLALLRIEAGAGSSLQAALWDRLLSLPASFFRQFTAGELATNAMGFDRLRTILTGTVVSSVITFFSSLFSFGLLFKYDLKLASIALLMAIITIVIVIINTLIQLKYQRTLNRIASNLSGYIFQLLGGITKLRVAGAESRALDRWASKFSKQKKVTTKARLTNATLGAFNSSWQVIITMVIFWSVTTLLGGQRGISPGDFLAFNSAFGQFFGAMLGIAGIVSSFAHAAPHYEDVKPILEAMPEVTPDKVDPGELKGHIELSHIKFRYGKDLPLILNDVSIDIQPGQFVALVGPSGSGKSSLFRLLLGFDHPEQGTLYFDGQDISTLDVQAIRRQIGVVIQNAKIMPGDIFTNIVGSQPYTLDDAWEAARMAGFDQDIKMMPMGMHTYLSEGGGALSGGQKQRLMIARALIGRPKLLLFDEATSALDNQTQAIVTESVEKLRATRIVIAHRLSTIEQADKIIVLTGGKFAQIGTYQELIKTPGPFQELAKRQLA